jgi:hypothetical protein
MLFGDEHVRLYEQTGGRIGHDWEAGAPVLILSTTGRKSGQERKTPVIYHRDEAGDYLLVASKGGAPAHPHWYLNLVANPLVTVQVKRPEVPRTRTHGHAGGKGIVVAAADEGVATLRPLPGKDQQEHSRRRPDPRRIGQQDCGGLRFGKQGSR